MDRKSVSVIQTVGGLEEFEQLVERGRQLHNQAVFELFARLVSNAVHALRKSSSTIRKQDSEVHGQSVYLKQTSRNHV